MFIDGFASPEHVRRERRKAQELRDSQWWRQQVGSGICRHCEKKVGKERLTMDHVIPVARGGKSAKNNVVPSCKACNATKGHLLPVERIFLGNL